MQLAAVVLARVVAFIETFDLNPRGGFHFPALVSPLVDRFGFVKFPQKAEDFDETKGVLFDGGKAGNISGVRFQVYNHAIVAECGSSTSDSDRILEDTLLWASEKFGLSYRSGMIKRRAYVSQVTFHSEDLLTRLNPALLKACATINARVPEYFGQKLEYRPTSFGVQYDPMTTKNGTCEFSVAPRADVPYSENKYFSTAPLPTEEHIELLENLEKDMLAS